LRTYILLKSEGKKSSFCTTERVISFQFFFCEIFALKTER